MIKRIIFNTVTVLSFLLSIATVLLWHRSYITKDALIAFRNADHMYVLYSGDGSALLWHSTCKQHFCVDKPGGYAMFELASTDFTMKDADVIWQTTFGKTWVTHLPHGRDIKNVVSCIPDWPIVILFLVVPLIWLYGKIWLPAPGTCAKCGYDMRATPDMCPECGTMRC